MWEAVLRMFFEAALWNEKRRQEVEDKKAASRKALEEEFRAADKRKP